MAPIGHQCEFENFEDCVAKIKKPGMTDEEARAICGALQRDTKDQCIGKASPQAWPLDANELKRN